MSLADLMFLAPLVLDTVKHTSKEPGKNPLFQKERNRELIGVLEKLGMPKLKVIAVEYSIKGKIYQNKVNKKISIAEILDSLERPETESRDFFSKEWDYFKIIEKYTNSPIIYEITALSNTNFILEMINPKTRQSHKFQLTMENQHEFCLKLEEIQELNKDQEKKDPESRSSLSFNLEIDESQTSFRFAFDDTKVQIRLTDKYIEFVYEANGQVQHQLKFRNYLVMFHYIIDNVLIPITDGKKWFKGSKKKAENSTAQMVFSNYIQSMVYNITLIEKFLQSKKDIVYTISIFFNNHSNPGPYETQKYPITSLDISIEHIQIIDLAKIEDEFMEYACDPTITMQIKKDNSFDLEKDFNDDISIHFWAK